ncbi:beta-galactosidase [Novosphingobium sp. 9]|uniref:beta-galactosidase n=1 Tax=Novosphingobium sp. 9 TaxID=2025349 RepID=UPI0021B572D4|nr:beta-galactosidase [Novosphingobium sp. 9]
MIRRRTVLAGLTASAAALSRPGWSKAASPAAKAGATGSHIRFEVRGAGLHPEVRGAVANWGGKGARGDLSANTCHLERNGAPLTIVAGEVHPQRLPPEEWEPAIVQMKAAGLNTVSSYIFWNQIERRIGEYDFSGRNDLRTFFSLCAKHDMMVVLRIGPFTNAEFLLGGLPVWLYGLPTTERSNEPLYLDLVARYYVQLGAQVHDLLWEHGGPIAIVQLENELSVAPIEWNRPFLYGAPADGHTGPTGPAFTEHYRKLHAMAVTAGLRAPFYSVTAWGANDPYPTEVVMPTFGGYMDLSPPGAQNSELTVFQRQGSEYDDTVPIGFIEIGYGSPQRDTFRPRPPADSGYASTMTLFGASRSLMVGYYMFRGGSNPVDGDRGWTIKNAMFPLVSYDFWAPISEYGEWRDSLYRARPFNLFLRHYAADLARAEPRSPLQPVTRPEEDGIRAEARIGDGRGFVFVSNYGNVNPLPARPDFVLELDTDRGAVRIPHEGTLPLPSGTMAIWPVNLDLGAGVVLRSATVQPVCRFVCEGEQWHVFTQIGSLPAELVFDRDGVAAIQPSPRVRIKQATDGPAVVAVQPGRGSVVKIRSTKGSTIRLLVLTETDARNLADLGTQDAPLFALSPSMVTRSGDTIAIASRDGKALEASFFPPLANGAEDGVFGHIASPASPRSITADIARLGDERALVKLPATAFDGLDEIFLDIAYSGDVCRIFDAQTGILVADTMNNGIPWAVGLRRFQAALSGAGLLVRVEPVLVGGDAVKLAGSMTLKPEERAVGVRAALTSLTFSPRYVAHVEVA